MTAVATVGGLLVIGVVAACRDPDPYPVASGLYQLSTAQVDGDRKLDWALRPGPLMVGSVMPSAAVASSVSVDVAVCGHPDADPSCAGLGTSYDFGLARDGNHLVGSQGGRSPAAGWWTTRRPWRSWAS